LWVLVLVISGYLGAAKAMKINAVVKSKHSLTKVLNVLHCHFPQQLAQRCLSQQKRLAVERPTVK
jgi:hypothetical protein